MPRPALPSGDTREGSPRTSSGSARCSTPATPSCRGPRSTAAATRRLWEWLIFEEEYYRAGAPQRVTQNGIFLLAPTIFEFGTPRAAGPHPRARWRPASRRGARAGRSRTRAATSPASSRRRCATTRPAAGGSRARRRGRRAARSARTSSACSAAIPTPNATEGLTYFLVDLATPGVTVRPVERLDGDEGFAEVFFDDVFVPDADVLGEPNKGWGVAMATTGSERGLTLRSPGPVPRDRATAHRPVPRARRRSRRCRDRLVAAWIDAEAYRWQTFWTVTRLVEGRTRRRGVEPGEAVLVGARRAAARARARTARSARGAARRRRRGVDEGLPVRARGPDLRRHQRDPAQRGRRTRARACRGR